MTVVLGIDPGGVWTGMTARTVDGYVAHKLYCRRRHEPIDHYARRVSEHLVTDWLLADDPELIPDIAGIEGLNTPNPHVRVVALQGILDTAVVFGILLGQLQPTWAHVIPPGNHGAAFLRAYPPELVGAKEKKGSGELRHCRSAWDIAGAALAVHRMKTREIPA